MGSIKELGNWEEFVCPMTWTEGHIWVTDDLVTQTSIFQYKYVVKQEHDQTIWETGMNRLADLTVLTNQAKGQGNQVKHVQLLDEWEHFTIKFAVNYNLDNDYYNLRINGSREELGNWKVGSGPVQMDRSETARWFMPSKYGAKLKPWEIFVRMRNDITQNNNTLKYNYSVKKDSWNDEIWEWEREPARTLRFLEPEHYTGQKEKEFDLEQTGSDVFVVNGQVEKADGNFVSHFFIQ